MGILRVSREYQNGDDRWLLDLALSFLRREHKATIQGPFNSIMRTYEYVIEGEDIPERDENFNLIISEPFPNVLSIKIGL